MTAPRLLVCADLDRTLIPNGPQAESAGARDHFATLVSRAEVTLAYVSGRHRPLVQKAITNYRLPMPDFVIGDVGTTIYRVGADRAWQQDTLWEAAIGRDWGGRSHTELKALLADLTPLRPQEAVKQNRYKLSYYVPIHQDRDTLATLIRHRLDAHQVSASLVWSVDEPAGVGLLDVLPLRASKYHAIEALMTTLGFGYANTVFCGDSGNDIEVLASPIPAVLVANSQPEVRALAIQRAEEQGFAAELYIARGGFMGMNGNYAGGVLEGIAYYYPHTAGWMGFAAA